MKRALLARSGDSWRLAGVVGPINPETGQPITADTALCGPAHGFEWRSCGDEVTLETHDFDGEKFALKPPQPTPPAPPTLAEQIATSSPQEKAEIRKALGL